jgi:hypothetical protein
MSVELTVAARQKNLPIDPFFPLKTASYGPFAELGTGIAFILALALLPYFKQTHHFGDTNEEATRFYTYRTDDRSCDYRHSGCHRDSGLPGLHDSRTGF